MVDPGDAPTWGPLVEPIADDATHAAVTFRLPRAPQDRRAALVGNKLFARDHLDDALMTAAGDDEGTPRWELTLRLPTDHRGSYQFAVDSRADGRPAMSLTELMSHGTPDPGVAEQIPMRWADRRASVLTLAHAPANRWQAQVASTVTRGEIRVIPLSAPGIVEREVYLYRSPGISASTKTPVIVLLDGDMWLGRTDLPRQLDWLLATGQIAPVTVVAPSAVDIETRWREMTAQDGFADFLVGPLMTAARTSGAVSSDPARYTVAGQSLGGLTALHTATRHPDVFGNAIAESPSLWWQPGSARRVPAGDVRSDRDGEPMWLAAHLAKAARHQRFRIAVGRYEGGMVTLAHRAAEQLTETGAEVVVTEVSGGHDHAWWRVHLLDAIVEFAAPTCDLKEPAAQ